MIPFNHVFKELFAERTRILLTILAIAWGTASITIMLALGEGLRMTFGRSMKGIGEGILMVRGRQTSKPYGGLPEGRSIRLMEGDLKAVRDMVPEIAEMSGEYDSWRPMRYEDNFRTGRVAGVDPDFGAMRNVIPKPGGRFINPTDIQSRRRVIVIGTQVVKELFGDENLNPVGRYMEVDGRPFMVIGVMKKKFQMSSYGVPDRNGAWIPSSTFRVMYGRRHYADWILRPHKPEQMKAVKAQILQIMANRHGCDPEDEEIVIFWDTLEMQEMSLNVFYGLQTMLGVIGGLTLIVAGVGIANVMYVSVSNATRDIGIRMAVGARDHQVLIQYVLEGLLATAIGGALGLVVSVLVITGVEQVPMNGEFFEFVGKPVPVFSPLVAGIVVGVLGVIGFFAGIFPARRAARIEPAEALRYE